MLFSLAKRMFGTVNDRIIKEMTLTVEEINSLEQDYQKLSDQELRDKTIFFRTELKNGKTLNDILPDVFANCREVSKRVLNMRHFDVQLMGGIILHQGMIAEMRTGEGKTLVSTLAAYLNALEGRGVYVVTVNDYLAQRDSEWMGKLYQALGLSIGCIYSSMDEQLRKTAYLSDITYGTNNEFGFDFLRDNLKMDLNEMVQRDLSFAIIDEVDSILIDEARTPLVISGPAEDSSELYQKLSKLIIALKPDHYEIDEKSKSSFLTDIGTDFVEKLLKKTNLIEEKSSLYDIENTSIVHHINQALKALLLFKKDVDYLVKDNEVLIIDEFTGRIMSGRRYSEGLHQALEAKENVKIQEENQTLASTTFQNYFRNFKKLAGMTGTAITEEVEFSSIYNLDVVALPTNKKDVRKDYEDEIYKNNENKFLAIIEQVKKCYEKGQPVLIGTISIEKSELLSKLLKKQKIKHNVLNAKHHQQEAHIIANAGRFGAVTIATNMAGRGTDIQLGGNAEMISQDKKQDLLKVSEEVAREKAKVLEAGGLFVIGTERHESRRIDNQLRGRSARQGDVGETKFFLSLEDDLMRIFASDKIAFFLNKLGLKDDEAITHPWISKALEKAQKKVEGHNFEIRKSLIKFDDVLNEQRKVVYAKRKEILKAESVSGTIDDFVLEINQKLLDENIPAKSYIENWNLKTLDIELNKIYGESFNIEEFAQKDGRVETEIFEEINKISNQKIVDQRSKHQVDIAKLLEKHIMIIALDGLWKDHLHMMDHLKTGINLQAYGQKDPLNEYKKEAFLMFESLLDHLIETTIQRFSYANVEHISKEYLEEDLEEKKNLFENKLDAEKILGRESQDAQIISRINQEDRKPSDPNSWGKIGRNEICPCGSKKKYKSCHGKI